MLWLLIVYHNNAMWEFRIVYHIGDKGNWNRWYYVLTKQKKKRKTLEAAAGGVLCKKGVLRNFKSFTRKYLCQSPFFIKVAGWGLFCFFAARFFLFWISAVPRQHGTIAFQTLPNSFPLFASLVTIPVNKCMLLLHY